MDFKFVLFDTTTIENHDIIKNINNLYLSASLLLMKNVFKDIKELKPILKKIVKLDDDRVVRLFEYIVVNKDIEKEQFNEILLEVKGEDKMSTLAQRWLDKGKQLGLQQGIQQGFEKGIEKGVKKGKKNGKLESAYIMVTKYHLPLSQIAKDFGLEELELKEYIQNRL